MWISEIGFHSVHPTAPMGTQAQDRESLLKKTSTYLKVKMKDVNSFVNKLSNETKVT